jgi:molybdopterin converting factor small subunit
VYIHLFGSFREAAGTSEDEVELTSDPSIYGLLTELAGVYGERFRDALFDGSGMLREDVMMTVNKVIINHADVTETVLCPGDEFALLPIFTGGG